jgi:hypothetical protein
MIFAAALLGASALTAVAQTSTTPPTDANTPAVATPGSNNPIAPVAGYNSFTEAQAKERIETAGYSGVTALKLDDEGIWQSTAMKDGKSVSVSLDYQDNIVAM